MPRVETMGIIQSVRTAISNLNPAEIREEAGVPIQVLSVASSAEAYSALEDFLTPRAMSEKRRWVGHHAMSRAIDADAKRHDLLFIESGLALPDGWEPGKTAFRFDPLALERLPKAIRQDHPGLLLPLAKRFAPFRKEAIQNAILTVARENAFFSLATALPNVLPSFMSLPWAASEFASDTAVLTANQIRMAFLLAAASDRDVGYSQQKTEIGGIIAGALGWRSLARELVGKIPFGGGLIPKAAVAYAGTYVVGQSLERLYRSGYGFSGDEKKQAFHSAFHKGKEVAGELLERLKKDEPKAKS
ncbi:MAG: hypothetical protein IT161_20820 [Bryobacterales bacterium]|nr:hypothetical protein [Bryobacterales bacterium]